MNRKTMIYAALSVVLCSSGAFAEKTVADVRVEPSGTSMPECMSAGHIETSQPIDGKAGDALGAARRMVVDRGGNTLTTDMTSHLSDTKEHNWTTAFTIIGEAFWCPEISVQPNRIRRQVLIDPPKLPPTSQLLPLSRGKIYERIVGKQMWIGPVSSIIYDIGGNGVIYGDPPVVFRWAIRKNSLCMLKKIIKTCSSYFEDRRHNLYILSSSDDRTIALPVKFVTPQGVDR